ncbi:hypothetical protein [Pseudonocardia pini]|uniref:hypothetical protein n=1 Tax=Pseudonocardia pini TaxID=2758030 RepID=UPI0015F11774|nr:hypothetical protein [Pseudonocardia pini]
MTGWTRARTAALLALTAALLAGCAGTATSTARLPEPVPQAAPNGTALLWPVTDVAAAQDLQTEVDGGTQPWTLDPEEVALGYATATWGWTNPEPTSTAPGTVALTDPAGTATLTLVQPVRAGTTGIWVVSTALRTS